MEFVHLDSSHGTGIGCSDRLGVLSPDLELSGSLCRTSWIDVDMHVYETLHLGGAPPPPRISTQQGLRREICFEVGLELPPSVVDIAGTLGTASVRLSGSCLSMSSLNVFQLVRSLVLFFILLAGLKFIYMSRTDEL